MITPEEYGTLMELCQNRRGIFKDNEVFDPRADNAEL